MALGASGEQTPVARPPAIRCSYLPSSQGYEGRTTDLMTILWGRSSAESQAGEIPSTQNELYQLFLQGVLQHLRDNALPSDDSEAPSLAPSGSAKKKPVLAVGVFIRDDHSDHDQTAPTMSEYPLISGNFHLRQSPLD
ncbi:hypothetical protein CONLIGDRAFT_648151 [Coniochaeta ligniaria NRRL 30616]|uniref:Uncharacterized protein n=1 Tax=Coniochaeta ligniaria NRRL 30616 TaxID=1408157 RepID=A0A1J7IVG2_9PEZI|nr:hypothetical protein CONLIGDRAFT_648151 [Coniochaeta ligniaria NRRL 30616]